MFYTLESHNKKELVDTNTLFTEAVHLKPILSKTEFDLFESTKGEKKKALIVEMEAIHVGLTANNIFYTEDGLIDGITSWTHPYNKPVLTHHDHHSGEPIGRILSAEFKEFAGSGRKGLQFKVAILDESAQEKVLDGRYETVSIGAKTDKAICNICGTNRAEDWCSHWKGETYEGQKCHYSTGTVHGVEVSYVNVPADKDAGNRSVYYAEQSAISFTEGEIVNPKNPEVNLLLSLSESEQTILNENYGNLFQTNTKTGDDEQMKLEEALGKIKDLETQLQESKTQYGEISLKNNGLTEQLSEKDQEIELLMKENKELKKLELSNLIESIVDMKIELNKPETKGAKREDLIEKHSARTRESLQDLHGDLLLEFEDKKHQDAKGNVEDPRANGSEKGKDAGGSADEGKYISEREAGKLLSGLFSKK